jgi:hypothetical protein
MLPLQEALARYVRAYRGAHLAYIHGGLAALEACLTAAEERPLLEAFRMLDAGAHRLCDPATFEEGRTLIDQAAVAMLRHEQMTILPPFMERLSDLGRRLASLGTWLDFEGAPGLVGQPSFSGYYGPLPVLLGTRSIANTRDRWTWIENDLLPKWFALSAAYSEGCPVDRRLAAFAEGRPTALQHPPRLGEGARLLSLQPSMRLRRTTPQ